MFYKGEPTEIIANGNPEDVSSFGTINRCNIVSVVGFNMDTHRYDEYRETKNNKMMYESITIAGKTIHYVDSLSDLMDAGNYKFTVELVCKKDSPMSKSILDSIYSTISKNVETIDFFDGEKFEMLPINNIGQSIKLTIGDGDYCYNSFNDKYKNSYIFRFTSDEKIKLYNKEKEEIFINDDRELIGKYCSILGYTKPYYLNMDNKIKKGISLCASKIMVLDEVNPKYEKYESVDNDLEKFVDIT